MPIDIKKDAAPAAPATPAPAEKVTLELRAYNRYVRNDVLYEKGEGYTFTKETADILLEETDEVAGMPIWGRWKPAAKRMVVEREVQPTDMTGAKVVALPTDDEAKSVKSVQIGDDSEIADLLPKDDGQTI